MTPEHGRALWKQALEDDNPFNPVLQHVLMSVLIDIVEKRIELSDTLAISIGTRIEFLAAARIKAHECRNIRHLHHQRI